MKTLVNAHSKFALNRLQKEGHTNVPKTVTLL